MPFLQLGDSQQQQQQQQHAGMVIVRHGCRLQCCFLLIIDH
jgi:hypothetical protein